MGNVKMKVIADPIHNTIPFTSIEAYVLSSRIFNRLHNILQNSMAYLVFPSTKTPRFTHSVGVMHVATEMFMQGCLNSTDDNLTNFIYNLGEEFKGVLNSKEVRDRLALLNRCSG